MCQSKCCEMKYGKQNNYLFEKKRTEKMRDRQAKYH